MLESSPSGGETQLSFSVLVDLLADEVVPVLPKLPSPQHHALRKALLLEESAGMAPDELTIAAGTSGALAALAQPAPVLLHRRRAVARRRLGRSLAYAARRLGGCRWHS